MHRIQPPEVIGVEHLLTVDEVAAQLRVQRATVYEWLKSGSLRGLKAGRVWRIRPADVEAFLRRPREVANDGAHRT